MLLLLAAAFAQSPDPVPLDVPPPVVTDPTFRDRVNEAVSVRRGGDVEAAKRLLVALEPLVTEPDRAWYLYQRGICEELTWHPDAARTYYDQIIALGPSEVALDAHFRRALVLEDVGEDDLALAELRYLDQQKGLSESDDITIQLQRGISELAVGKRVKGIKHVQAALAVTEGSGGQTYMRAKGRYALVRALLEEANDLPLRGSERKVVKNLKGRAERVEAATQQIIAMTQLQEPEWVLASLVCLGDSYALLADDLAGAPVPKKLNAIQLRVYQDELAKKVQNVRTKAFHSYDQGVALATRLAWESPNAQTLIERRKEMEGER